jgi:hypothetical protein
VYFHNMPVAAGSEMGLEGYFGHIWKKVME